jgi:hypothetical protein
VKLDTRNEDFVLIRFFTYRRFEAKIKCLLWPPEDDEEVDGAK